MQPVCISTREGAANCMRARVVWMQRAGKFMKRHVHGRCGRNQRADIGPQPIGDNLTVVRNDDVFLSGRIAMEVPRRGA